MTRGRALPYLRGAVQRCIPGGAADVGSCDVVTLESITVLHQRDLHCATHILPSCRRKKLSRENHQASRSDDYDPIERLHKLSARFHVESIISAQCREKRKVWSGLIFIIKGDDAGDYPIFRRRRLPPRDSCRVFFPSPNCRGFAKNNIFYYFGTSVSFCWTFLVCFFLSNATDDL